MNSLAMHINQKCSFDIIKVGHLHVHLSDAFISLIFYITLLTKCLIYIYIKLHTGIRTTSQKCIRLFCSGIRKATSQLLKILVFQEAAKEYISTVFHIDIIVHTELLMEP